jgi:hypothetical protein
METMLGISLYSYLYLKQAKMLCLTIAQVLSSTKLEKRAERVLPGSKGERWRDGVVRGRDGPNNVCTYE